MSHVHQLAYSYSTSSAEISVIRTELFSVLEKEKMSNHGGKHAGAGPKSANYYATGYKPAGTSDVRVAPDPELEAAQVKMERLLQEARGQRKA